MHLSPPPQRTLTWQAVASSYEQTKRDAFQNNVSTASMYDDDETVAYMYTMDPVCHSFSRQAHAKFWGYLVVASTSV